MNYYSQSGQDAWVNEYLRQQKGYFVDIGAYDGVALSNSCYFEKMGWKGICVEGNPIPCKVLSNNRACICVHAAITNFNGEVEFGGDAIGKGVKVPALTLNKLLELHNAPTLIDYISIDTEGHEFVILEAFDFDKYTIKMMTIETNLYLEGVAKKEKLYNLLTAKGYIRTHEDVISPAGDPFEDWYVHKNYIK